MTSEAEQFDQEAGAYEAGRCRPSVVEAIEERAEVGSGKLIGHVRQALDRAIPLPAGEREVVAQNVCGDALHWVVRTVVGGFQSSAVRLARSSRRASRSGRYVWRMTEMEEELSITHIVTHGLLHNRRSWAVAHPVLPLDTLASMSERRNAFPFWPEGYEALQRLHGLVEQSGLERELLELVKLRASQINRCAYCIDMHSKDPECKERLSSGSTH